MNKNINALKFILALMVIYCHADIYPEIGHFAVCMFFMLSGYLTKSKIERQNGCYYFFDIKKQFYRIAPAYYLLLLLFTILQLVILKKIDHFSLFAHVCLAQSWFSYATDHQYNGPTWYLSSYFAILLILALIHYFFRTDKKRQIIFLVTMGGVILMWLALSPFMVNQHWWDYYFPLAHLSEFGFGFFIHEMQNKWECVFLRHTNRLCIIGFVLFLMTLTYSQYIHTTIVKENLIYLPASWFVVTWFVYTDEKRNKGSVLLHAKWIQMLGKLSLQLFIYHLLVIRLYHYVGIDDFSWSAIIIIPSCICFAVMMDKYYEPLFLRKISQ